VPGLGPAGVVNLAISWSTTELSVNLRHRFDEPAAWSARSKSGFRAASAVLGTDAINQVRFEPNLNGIFVRVKLALVDPLDLSKTVEGLESASGLYRAHVAAEPERDQSVGDSARLVWTADGNARFTWCRMGSRNLVVIDAARERGLHSRTTRRWGKDRAVLLVDEARQLPLRRFHRFPRASPSWDTVNETVIQAVPLFEPDPLTIAAGAAGILATRVALVRPPRQASCAFVHADARDWIGSVGTLAIGRARCSGRSSINTRHLVTQRLSPDERRHGDANVAGNHWSRLSRSYCEGTGGLWSRSNPTLHQLAGAASGADDETEMRELSDFLAKPFVSRRTGYRGFF